MEADQENRVAEIKEEIELGSYRVDPQAVADAILRRLRELSLEDVRRTVPAGHFQNECS
jgi:hypothetical protein